MKYSQIFTILLHKKKIDLEEMIFENFNIFENNKISVEFVKALLLGYPF